MSLYSDDLSSSNVGLSSDVKNTYTNGIDQELQDFLLHEKQKAQFNAQIHEFNDFCWDKCLTDKPKAKLDNKTETCLNNCVDRFIDVSLLISNRFAMALQKNAQV